MHIGQLNLPRQVPDERRGETWPCLHPDGIGRVLDVYGSEDDSVFFLQKSTHTLSIGMPIVRKDVSVHSPRSDYDKDTSGTTDEVCLIE